MREVDGYAFDWLCANQPDDNLATFPRALVYVREETCDDSDRGAWANVYWANAEVEIIADVQIPSETDVPEFSIDAYCDDALDDLLRLFGSNPSLSSAGSLPVAYKSCVADDYVSGDYFLTKRISTKWSIRFTRSRTEPTLSGL